MMTKKKARLERERKRNLLDKFQQISLKMKSIKREDLAPILNTTTMPNSEEMNKIKRTPNVFVVNPNFQIIEYTKYTTSLTKFTLFKSSNLLEIITMDYKSKL